jgi:hypothetical protein
MMDARKKRNKKKKGNQTKNGDISNIEEAVAQEHGNGSSVTQLNQNGKVPISSEGAQLPEHDKGSEKQQPIQNGSFGSGASLLEQDKECNEKQPLQNGSVSVNSAIPSVMVPEPHKEINNHNVFEEKIVSASTGFSLCFGRF